MKQSEWNSYWDKKINEHFNVKPTERIDLREFVESVYNKKYGITESAVKLPALNGDTAAMVYETCVAISIIKGKVINLEDITSALKHEQITEKARKWFALAFTQAKKLSGKDKQVYSSAIVELVNSTGMPILTNDNFNGTLGKHTTWKFIHKDIDKFYKATDDYTDEELSGKQNTADMVIYQGEGDFLGSIKGGDLEVGTSGRKTTGVIYTSDEKFKFFQVSLKKAPGDARIGKVTAQLNNWIKKWTGENRPNVGGDETSFSADASTTSELMKLDEGFREIGTFIKKVADAGVDTLKKSAKFIWEKATEAYQWFMAKLNGLRKDILEVGERSAQENSNGDIQKTMQSIFQDLGVEEGSMLVNEDYTPGPGITILSEEGPAKIDNKESFSQNLDKLYKWAQEDNVVSAFEKLKENLSTIEGMEGGKGLMQSDLNLEGVDYSNFIGSIETVRKQLKTAKKSKDGKSWLIPRDDAQSNFLIDCIKLNSNFVGFKVFNDILENMIKESDELGGIQIAAMKYVTAMNVEASHGKTTLPLFIAYGGDKGGVKYLGPRDEKESQVNKGIKKTLGVLADPAYPIMKFEARISSAAQVKYMSKADADAVVAKQKKQKAKNITKFVNTSPGGKGDEYADQDLLKFGTDPKRGGRGVAYVAQYMSVMTPPKKAGGSPTYTKVQCINRSGSQFSFKMDAMSEG